MPPAVNRRRFLLSSTAVAVSSALLAVPAFAQPPSPPKPPALPGADVQATVGHAHRSLEEVRRLVDATPLLANACWDWGGGDFETPLEAAAHMGRRDIAEYLLSRGARPSLYAAGMLGHLDLVRAFLAGDPRAHEIPGPHGFTLWHCVKQGGEPAQPVLDWLRTQGVPEVGHRPLRFARPEGSVPVSG